MSENDETLLHALALGTGDLLRTSLNAYVTQVAQLLDQIPETEGSQALMADLIDKAKGGVANRQSFKRTLLSTLAQDIMFIIWRESEHLGESALSEAGIKRRFESNKKHLTVNSLKNAICDDREFMSASASDALRKQIERTVDALEVYGLIERKKVRDNLKPILGTQKLHELMLEAHTCVSQIYAKQLLGSEDGSDG